MQEFASTVSQNQRVIYAGLIATLLCYYLVMDVILYKTLQSVDLVKQSKEPGESWSPFHPLSVKLIMTDPTTHYIITPLSEHFNEITKFSKTFYFITPNMITFAHLTLSFLAARFVFSESLKYRRIGVLIFEIKIFLDAFDGTVYRSRAADKLYSSHHSNFGFWFDSICDTLGAAALSFGILFYLWWKCPPRAEATSSNTLPWTADEKCDSKINLMTEEPVMRNKSSYSKQFIFFRCFCFGLQMGVSSAMWDQITQEYELVFMTKLDSPELATLQSTYLHSAMTWLIFWCWRMVEGQSLQQMYLGAIFVDKVWEFLRFIQYVGFIVILMLVGFSFYHVAQIQQSLHL